jgi:hypothetical protein
MSFIVTCDLTDNFFIQDKTERKKSEEYTRLTYFDNNAEAPNKPYPPGFKLYVGEKCIIKAKRLCVLPLDSRNFPGA